MSRTAAASCFLPLYSVPFLCMTETTMKKRLILFCAIQALIFLPSCDKESDNPADGGTAGLSASARNLKLLSGAEASVILSGGTLPYVIESQSDPAVASASLDSRTLLISAGALGTATIKVKDSAPTPKSLDVTVTVVSSYTAGIAGSFQFQSDRGAYSVSGVGSIGAAAPVSGSGVVALSEYGGLVVIAYTVVSPSRYDMATVLFLDSKNIAPGDYTYPTAGNRQVQISYMPDQDPADTTDTYTGYILANSGFASVTAMVNGAVSGTFSGNGFFVDHDTLKSAQTIQVTGGQFDCPVIAIGSAQQLRSDNPVVRNAHRFLRRR